MAQYLKTIDAVDGPLIKSSEAQRKSMLARFALHFPVQKMSEHQWGQFAKTYHDVLEGVPGPLLAEFETYYLGSDASRFPRPGVVLQWCKPKMDARAWTVTRLRAFAEANANTIDAVARGETI